MNQNVMDNKPLFDAISYTGGAISFLDGLISKKDISIIASQLSKKLNTLTIISRSTTGGAYAAVEETIGIATTTIIVEAGIAAGRFLSKNATSTIQGYLVRGTLSFAGVVGGFFIGNLAKEQLASFRKYNLNPNTIDGHIYKQQTQQWFRKYSGGGPLAIDHHPIPISDQEAISILNAKREIALANDFSRMKKVDLLFLIRMGKEPLLFAPMALKLAQHQRAY